MKLLTAVLIFSVLFSSLPTKVWACGLNFCPMDHGAAPSNNESSMPCHQVHSKSNQDVENRQNDNSLPEVTTSPSTCLCPNTHIEADYTVETHRIEIQNKISFTPTFEVLDLQNQAPSIALRNRPPPIIAIGRLQILLQSFLI